MNAPSASISIVIPAYNAARFLPATLESVLKQTVANWEMVIVDDGSKDDTQAVAQRYAAQDTRIRVLQQQNSGVSVARNNGLAATTATTDYLLFLDSDDLLHPEFLKEMTRELDQNPALVGAYCLIQNIDAEGEPTDNSSQEFAYSRKQVVGSRIVPCPPDALLSYNGLIVQNLAWPSNTLVRRSFVRQIDPFDPAFSGCADWDFFLRLSTRGDYVFVQRVLCYYRTGIGNMSSNARAMRQEDRAVLRKQAAAPDPEGRYARLARLVYRHRERHWMQDKLRLALGCARKGQVVPALKQCRYAAGHFVSYMRGL